MSYKPPVFTPLMRYRADTLTPARIGSGHPSGIDVFGTGVSGWTRMTGRRSTMQDTTVRVAEGWATARPGDVIGWWRHGPIHLLGGGAPDDPPDDDADGDDDNPDDQHEDDDSLFDHDDDADDGDREDEGDLTPAMQQAIEREANRIADRRINQILQNRDRGRGRGREKDDDDRDESGGDRRTRVRDSQIREARLVYREYVGDEVRFVSSDERTYAADLANGLLRDRLASGDDVEEAGRAVAREVSRRVQGLRRTYERGVIDRLKSRGHLPRDFKVKSQPRRNTDEKPGPGTAWKKGAERAKELRPERYPTTDSK